MGKKTKLKQAEIQKKYDDEMSSLRSHKSQILNKRVSFNSKSSMDDLFNYLNYIFSVNSPGVEKYSDELSNDINNHSGSWIRTKESWSPKGKSINSNIIHVFQHLFCRYSYPKFFNSLFYYRVYFNHYDRWSIDHDIDLGFRSTLFNNYFQWFKIISNGLSPYKYIFSEYKFFTKKMVYYFMTAPQWVSNPTEAIIYSYVKTLCKNESDLRKLFNLISSRIPNRATILSEHTFNIVRFFASQNYEEYKSDFEELYDYLINIGMNNRTEFFKGRTLNSVRNLSNIWHIENRYDKSYSHLYWAPMVSRDDNENASKKWEIPVDYDGYKITYNCIELTNGTSLIREGKEQHHCVASYTRACSRGECRIFKLWCSEIGERVTIEVRRAKVVQVRYRFNASNISSSTRKALSKWCQETGVTISKFN